MSIFDSFVSTDSMEQQQDSVGGFQLFDSDAYPAKVKTVYITHSKSGAMAANVVLDINNREYKEQLWITNSEGHNFYKSKKTGNKVPLPGFTTLNDLCLCSLGKELKELDVESRAFKIYDYDAKSEVVKQVPTIVELMDSEIIVGLIKQTVDKTTKNDNGDYVPTGETREENVIDKIFHAATHKTVNEAKSQVEEAQFYDKWLEKNKGNVRNRAKGIKEGASGRPSTTTTTATTQPKPKSLFG